VSIHHDRLLEHRRIWRERPILQEVYRDWFEIFLEALPMAARVVEVGAGPGFLTEHARLHRPDLRWIATELLDVPWNDAVANAEQLPFRDGSIDAVVGLDVLHHLSAPRRFLAGAARALAPGGRLLFVEPWVTPFSYPIYRWLHQEGCDTTLDPWHPFPESSKDPWDGDAAVPWGLVRKSPSAIWEELGLSVPQVRLLNGFAYLATLGFRERSLLPARAVRWLREVDTRSSGLASIFGLRAVLTWRRSAAPGVERAAQD
jgi:SAM-dependent methyltransferase